MVVVGPVSKKPLPSVTEPSTVTKPADTIITPMKTMNAANPLRMPREAIRLGAGVMTVGMPIGLAVIVFTIVITGLYVRRANGEYDALTEQIAKAALK